MNIDMFDISGALEKEKGILELALSFIISPPFFSTRPVISGVYSPGDFVATTGGLFGRMVEIRPKKDGAISEINIPEGARNVYIAVRDSSKRESERTDFVYNSIEYRIHHHPESFVGALDSERK